METIDAGDVPVEQIVHLLFSDAGLKKLIGHHGVACFVLARSGLSPRFHEKLIKNVETIDATTRNHVAFIVFHGNDASIIRRPSEGWRAYQHHLTGLSVSRDGTLFIDEHHGDPIEVRFDRELASSIRSSARSLPLKRIARAMDVATTAIVERFDLPEQALPCLLFVAGSQIDDAQLVQLSPEQPMESLYKDVLAPLSDEFRALESLWELRHRIQNWLDAQANAQVTIETFPGKLKDLEAKLSRAKAVIEKWRGTPKTQRENLIVERDRLRAWCSAYKAGVLDIRLAMLPADSKHYPKAHEANRRLKQFEEDKKAAYSEPLTPEKQELIGRLSSSVNRLRGKLGTAVGMEFVEINDRLRKIENELSRTPTMEQVESDARSIEHQIQWLAEAKSRAEKTIASAASFDVSFERRREREQFNHLQERGYNEEVLLGNQPRAIDAIRIMATQGRIGFSTMQPSRAKEKLRILFLAANPKKTTSLDLEEELRAIELELRGTRYRDRIEFVPRHAVRPDDLVRLIRAQKPNILHFSGHGASQGIFLRDDDAGYQIVNGEALARLLKGRGVQMVVLNACFSIEQSHPLSAAVDTVIGTTAQVDDEAARRFSVAFYRTLGDGHTIADAFRDGGDAIELYNLPDVYKMIGKTSERFVGP